MNATLLNHFFFIGCIKVLQKFAEANDVNEFMRDNIQRQREQGKRCRFVRGSENGMILQANFIKIICG